MDFPLRWCDNEQTSRTARLDQRLIALWLILRFACQRRIAPDGLTAIEQMPTSRWSRLQISGGNTLIERTQCLILSNMIDPGLVCLWAIDIQRLQIFANFSGNHSQATSQNPKPAINLVQRHPATLIDPPVR